MNSTAIYIPVPTWDGKKWIPCDYRGDNALLEWPEGIDPEQLPKPPVFLGQRVMFKWGLVTLEGEVREVKLSGGTITYDDYDGFFEDYNLRYKTMGDVLAAKYGEDEMMLTIYANGHARWVSRNKLVGV